MVSVIIVSYNTKDILRNCLQALFTHSTGIDLEVFVVDNNSADDSALMVQNEFPSVRLTGGCGRPALLLLREGGCALPYGGASGTTDAPRLPCP